MGFNNTSEGPISSIEWDFGDGTTSTEQNPDHAYTIADTYTVQLTVSGPGGTDTVSRSDLITVDPGPPVSLEISPTSVTLAVQQDKQLSAVVFDEFGNVAPGVVTWVLEGEGGSITNTGLFTADTMAVTSDDAVKATLEVGTDELVATASVIVEPGPIAKVEVEPAEVTLDIGSTQPITFRIFDEFDNEISGALASWNVMPDVGVLDNNGVLTSGTKAGVYPGGIRLEVVKGTDMASATTNIAIRPDPLVTIEIEPSLAVIEKGATHQFVASGFDQYGNAIPGLAFLWETDGGEITQKGLYTASESGSFPITASATFKESKQNGSGVADVPLVAYWPADGNAEDVAGGHHGDMRSSATFAPGVVGQAFRFPRSGAHMEVLIRNDDFNYAPTQPMAIEFWAKRTYPAGPLPDDLGMHLLGKRTECDDSPIHYQMHYDFDDWGFGSHGGGASGGTQDFDLLPFDQWRHLIVTFDGFVFRIYADGVLVAGPGFGTFESPNDAPLLIGGSSDCSTFIGLIDEVRVYNRALSDDEIRARYEIGNSGL